MSASELLIRQQIEMMTRVAGQFLPTKTGLAKWSPWIIMMIGAAIGAIIFVSGMMTGYFMEPNRQILKSFVEYYSKY